MKNLLETKLIISVQDNNPTPLWFDAEKYIYLHRSPEPYDNLWLYNCTPATALRLKDSPQLRVTKNHVHLLSDELIKPGDLVYIPRYNTIKEVMSYAYHNTESIKVYDDYDWDTERKSYTTYSVADWKIKKIVATTNPALKLPLIPKELVINLIKVSWEHRRKISTVYLETKSDGKLKLNADGTVINTRPQRDFTIEDMQKAFEAKQSEELKDDSFELFMERFYYM